MDTGFPKTKLSLSFKLTVVQVLILIMVSISVLMTTAETITNYISQRNIYELQVAARGLAQVVMNTSYRNDRIVEEIFSSSKLNIEVVILNSDLNIVLNTLHFRGQGMTLPSEIRDAVLMSKTHGSWDRYLYVIEKFSSLDNTGYILAFSPQDEQILIRDSLIWSVLRVIVIAVLIGLLFGTYLTGRLVEPLQNLEKRLRAISEGDFTGRMQGSEDDELGDLAKTFNDMSQQLESYQRAQLRFIQNASHELKSPLMNIQGYAEGLQAGLFNESEIDEALDIIVSESQRLKSVVEELLFMSRIEDSGVELEFGIIELDEIINDALRTVYTRIQQKELDLQVIIGEDIAIRGNYSTLQRAFANILDNGVRYAKSRILIQCQVENSQVVVRFVDDGPGFDIKEMPKVFERFFKGEKGSTGLGMAIVKDVMNLHKGEVQIYNYDQGGAVVELRFNKQL